MMSAGQDSDNLETLFSFELLVECIRLERESQVSDELAVGVRLLDFPTLLIYQPQKSINQHDQQGEHAFNRGKSCFFKMNLSSLHTQLCSSPLYAMVLDVKEEIPRLVGTSLISLAKVMDRIRLDVTGRGASAPSSHGERGLVGVCNLTGEKIGSISLSYKLLSLGVSLLPHVTDSGALKSQGVHVEQHVRELNMRKSISTDLLPLDCAPTLDKSDVGRNIPNKPSNESNVIHEDKQDNVAMRAERQTLKEPENGFEEDLTVFCPPHLFYNNSSEERSRNEQGDCKLLNLDSEDFTFEDTSSEEETAENKTEAERPEPTPAIVYSSQPSLDLQARFHRAFGKAWEHSTKGGLKCIHIPSVGGDGVAQNKDKSERHSESNQSQPESDRHRDKIESSGSSRCSTPSLSDSSGEGNEEADYADDFNSLEPSDAYSSSPEPSRAKTPRSPVRLDFRTSDSGSEIFQRRAVLPVPVKAPSSPQRTLRGTHIIRPRTHTSALSFSSEDGDRSASLQTICSRKRMTESGGVERSSGADSFMSSRGQRSESTRNSSPVRGFSVESVSSFEPQEAEELEDGLGSLDFRKEYQDISKLVANKLPGYTM
ncbi:hypothetical protein D5F01_LYC20954 [Larimichthys crocea]|uniref:Microtubule-associated protein 10 C-terminal domain-containing protein n=1 Tax=Larimichthys crocea TaxID=215358 RepID=A0A6G0HMT2_LARCR|nr:hypothetical protein D5F01_LYC20954 [Larimichthys crocea]